MMNCKKRKARRVEGGSCDTEAVSYEIQRYKNFLKLVFIDMWESGVEVSQILKDTWFMTFEKVWKIRFSVSEGLKLIWRDDERLDEVRTRG